MINFMFLFSSYGCGGWTTEVSDLKFHNVAAKVQLQCDFDMLIQDLDGSLSGSKNSIVVAPDSITTNNPNCRNDSYFVNALLCSSTNGWVRTYFSYYTTPFVYTLQITNSENQTVSAFSGLNGYIYSNGYLLDLESNQVYTITFNQASPITYIRYSVIFYGVKYRQFLIMQHIMKRKPDQIYFSFATAIESFDKLNSQSALGNWHWENSTSTFR